MLEKIFTGSWNDMSRYSIPGLIVIALGVALSVGARKWAHGVEGKWYYALKLGGLALVAVGAIMTLKPNF